MKADAAADGQEHGGSGLNTASGMGIKTRKRRESSRSIRPAVALLKVNKSLRTRRQHPRIINDRVRAIPCSATKSPV